LIGCQAMFAHGVKISRYDADGRLDVVGRRLDRPVASRPTIVLTFKANPNACRCGLLA
jgi:hypothetical protein